MCSNLEDDNYADLAANVKVLDIDELKKCKKCGNMSFVLLQKKDSLCQQCFHTYCCQKFRSTIGKSKLVKHGNKVLVAYSGGANSSALIQMVREGIDRNEHKKFLFQPTLIHVNEFDIFSDDDQSGKDHVMNVLSSSSWPSYLTSLEMAFRNGGSSFYSNVGNDQESVGCNNLKKTLRLALEDIKSVTAREEFIRRIRTQLIIDVAEAEGFDVVFTGSCGTRLAIQLITDVAQGKGNQIHLETGICDDRFSVPVLKPLREFVSKEITFYNQLKSIAFYEGPNFGTKQNKKSSLGKLTESFISGLQKDFPATVYTIYKIATKIEPKHLPGKCILCSADNDLLSKSECSAQDALQLSKSLCKGGNEEDSDSSLLLNSLCYGCTIIANEMNSLDTSLPKFVLKRTCRESVQEFLID